MMSVLLQEGPYKVGGGGYYCIMSKSVPSTILGTGNTAMNKTGKKPKHLKLTFK